MTTQPPPATTEPGDDAASINRAIAEQIGWTAIKGMTELVPSRGAPPGTNAWQCLPDYCGDYAAALGLLETVCRMRMSERKTKPFCVNCYFLDTNQFQCRVDMWSYNINSEADTLPLAIARACLAALRAIKETP